MTEVQVCQGRYQLRGQVGQWAPNINWLQRHTAMVPVLWQLYVRMALALVRIMAHWEMRVFRAKGGRIWLSLVTTRQARPRTVSGKERLPRASAGLLVAVQYQQPRQALQLRSDLEERDMTNSPGFARSRVPPIRRLGMATVAAACIVAVATVPDAAGASAPAGPANTSTADCNSLASCYSPRQLEEAYGILPLLNLGTDGRGQTVVLPELAEPQFPLPVSDIRQDVAEFDRLFNLPTAKLRVVTTLAHSASPWLANGEEVLDTEMVHAVAPGAAIVEVLVPATSLDNATSAVAASVAALRLGSSLGAVISISAAGQTGGEHCDSHSEVATLHAALQAAAAQHVTVIAASGDIGAVGEPCQVVKGLTGGAFPPVKEVNLPASDPLVLAAGGTTLTASRTTGAYVNESA